VVVKLNGTRSNRSAIGARVRITAGSTSQVFEVRGGGSYLSQNDLRVHAGLGPAKHIERIDVRWPNGAAEAWLDVRRNQVLTLTEGSGTAAKGSR
jgi:hypothetical protein